MENMVYEIRLVNAGKIKTANPDEVERFCVIDFASNDDDNCVIDY
jgi:hypothetical protein